MRTTLALLIAASLPSALPGAGAALAQDTSPAPILQWFEGTYDTLEERTADIFLAGYGGVWLPPPGRADSGNQSVGYDVYDRFDLGQPGRPTLYGTETGLKTVTRTFDKAGIDTHIDLVLNHNGFSDQGNDGFAASGGYPGFILQNPDGGSDPFGVPGTDGDFHGPFESGDIRSQLSGLLDINHATNHRFIRQPVAAGDPRNIPAGTDPQFGRLANRPDPNNARFYPDQQGSYIDVFDPATGEGGIRIYNFNTANPMAGDAVEENALGLLMRNAQWLVQEIGADHFRLDAAKHMEGFVFTYLDRAVYRSNPRNLLDGSKQHVFSYGEVFDTNRDYLLRGPDHAGANDWRDNFVRKDINNADPGRVGGNRDVLDFALQDALRDNLTGNGFVNDWRNVAYAGLDPYDDGRMNGSAGVKFVASHDDGGAELSNVAHAYTLLTPGNTVVYFNGREFDANRDFPKSTHRGDALGGMYGDTITELNSIRNSHGRGDYRERFINKEHFAFERSGSMLVMLSNRNDGGTSDWTNLNVDLPWGTPLVELTGNAARSGLPQVVTVTSDGFGQPNYIRTKFLNNGGEGKGYLVYGLQTPQSDSGVEISNVADVLEGGDFANSGGFSDDSRNGKTRLADLHVVKSNSFDLTLRTKAVNLLGSIRDRSADGDAALFSINAGQAGDFNGNGRVDHVTPGSVVYGFEEFTGTRSPGYFNTDGNGLYRQTIDATKLAEGMNFVTVRAFRQRSDGGPAVFGDFKKVVYVDRFKPESAVASFEPWTGGTSGDRDVIVRSLDKTADNVHVFLNLAAGLSDAQVLAMVNGGNRAGRHDRDLFKYGFGNLAHGNQVVTVVTYEITGTWNVQRFAGLFTQTTRGAGLGDLTLDLRYEGDDLEAMRDAILSADSMFNPAGDFTADGRLTYTDWLALGDELRRIRAAGTLRPDGFPLVSQGTLDYYAFLSGSVPEPGTAAVLAGVALLAGRRRR